MPPPHQKICPSPNPLEPVKVTLCGKRVFAAVIKDLEVRRSFWIIQVHPKSNDKCPYKNAAGGEWTHAAETQRKEDNVTTGAETGATWPQVQECQQPPEAGKSKGWILPWSLPSERSPVDP